MRFGPSGKATAPGSSRAGSGVLGGVRAHAQQAIHLVRALVLCPGEEERREARRLAHEHVGASVGAGAALDEGRVDAQCAVLDLSQSIFFCPRGHAPPARRGLGVGKGCSSAW